MKAHLINALAIGLLVLIPLIHFGQIPTLGAASSFALYTSAGAFDVLGASTTVTGDAGTNVGAFTGFPPGVIVGQIHVADPVTAQAAIDVASAYSQLSNLTCGMVITTTLGNGQVLAPNIYCLGAASTLNGDLTLDGQNDPNAIFIFQINGAMATSTLSNVFLINSASLCNVYWQINGELTLGEGSVFRGVVVNAGAIHLLEGSSLYGRGLSTAGAIDLHNSVVSMDMQPAGSVITPGGATTFCEGDQVILSGNNGGIWNTGATTATITVTAAGDYFVTNANACGSVVSNHIIVTVNPLPVASVITSAATIICEGNEVILSGNTGGTWNTGATSPTITVTASGDYFVTNTNNCGSISSNHILISVTPLPVASAISAGGATAFCEGDQVILTGNNGGTWNTGAKTASITVTAAGDYFVTNVNACGSVASNHIIVTVNPLPVASVISSAVTTICEGNEVILSGNTGGTWNTGATSPTITVTVGGDYFVTNTNNCGSISSNHILISVDPLTVASVITPDGATAFCEGGQVILSGNNGGTWNTGATTATITITATGDYFVTNTNGCGSINSNHVLVTIYPNPILVTHTEAVCSPLKIDLTNSSVTAGSTLYDATLSYWMDANATIPMPNPTNAGNGTYYIRAITSHGCFDIEPVTVVINPLPTVFTTTGSGSYCEGGPGLVVGLNNSQPGIIYTLQLCQRCPMISSITGDGGPISFGLQAGAGLYSVIAYNPITGCSNTMYDCIEITINPLLPVSVSITPSANPVVAGTAVTFTAISVNGGVTPTFQWKLNGLNAGTNSAAFTYTPANDDVVMVVLSSSESCVSGNPYASNIVTMEVDGVPPAIIASGVIVNGQVRCYSALQMLTFAGDGSVFTIESGGSATMIAGQSIRYLPGTTVLPGGHMWGYITSDGQYCPQKSPSIPTVTAGSGEHAETTQDASFRIYPNPTNGNFTLEQNGEKVSDNVIVEVYGITGERITAGSMNGNKKKEFLVQDTGYGIYFVKVVADDYAKTFKLVKTK